jgi:hypothetical protein
VTLHSNGYVNWECNYPDSPCYECETEWENNKLDYQNPAEQEYLET